VKQERTRENEGNEGLLHLYPSLTIVKKNTIGDTCDIYRKEKYDLKICLEELIKENIRKTELWTAR
jgi:hypothetical protein